MAQITFHFEGIATFPIAKETTNWLTKAILAEGKSLAELTYILCSDEYLLDINKQYLNHDYYTDVITFDHSDDKQSIHGDIFISTERIQENATEYANTFTDELNRVMVHGLLHLIGYRDKSPNEQNLMRTKEDAYLSLRTW